MSESIDLITQILIEFGKEEVELNFLSDFAKKILITTTSPDVKKSITRLLCELYKYIGQPLKQTLKDVKPVLLNNIIKEFDALVSTKPRTPSRTPISKQQEIELVTPPTKGASKVLAKTPPVPAPKKEAKKVSEDDNLDFPITIAPTLSPQETHSSKQERAILHSSNPWPRSQILLHPSQVQVALSLFSSWPSLY